jgi:hypothetical protein
MSASGPEPAEGSREKRSEWMQCRGEERRPGNPALLSDCSAEIAREQVQVELSAVRFLFELLGFLLSGGDIVVFCNAEDGYGP